MSKPLIEIINLKKSYGDFMALKGVSLTINAGEVMGLLGVNGAGKTTLSSILATLHPATAGDILFKGKSIYGNIPEFRKSIGYCPQKPNLNPLLSMRDNLYFAGRYFGMSEQQIAARLTELDERLGIGEYINHKADELSGGWKQRYMIARTLFHNPELVILDEPTVGLDPDIRRQLWRYISHIAESGVSVLLTTHYLDEAEKLSDTICLLARGEVKLTGTPEQLMADAAKSNLEDLFIELTNNKDN